MYLVVLYGIARGGRELDERAIWPWKRRDMEAPEEPVTMYWGLEKKDIVWGLLVVAGIGTIVCEIGFNFSLWIGIANGNREDVGFAKTALSRAVMAVFG